MKNYALKALLTVLLAEALILGLSALLPHVQHQWAVGATDTVGVNFPELASIFSFERPANENAAARVDELQAMINADPNDSLSNDTANDKFLIYNPLQEGRAALDNFFDALYALEHPSKGTKGPVTVRISHYGDSQIEGDRITQFIRQGFQQRFGGNGLGLVPLYEPCSHHGVERYISGNWLKYNVFQAKLPHGYYGASGMAFRFTGASKKGASAFQHDHQGGGDEDELPPIVDENPSGNKPPKGLAPDLNATKQDTINTDFGGKYSASVQFNLYNPQYDYVSLAWGGAAKPCILRIKADKTTVTDTLQPGIPFALTRLPVPANSKSISLEFSGPSSPNVYGLAFDGKTGVQVDNCAIRGHSGDGLKLINYHYLKEQIDTLNTKLIIVQFGGNQIPYVTPNMLKYIEDDFYYTLLKLKQAAPNASILVISVADMAAKVGDGVASYGIIPKIRDAQRNAATRAHCAFWDLYETMGGKGSIIEWVNQKPALASADFAHFSYAGQQLVGTLVFKAIMNEYDLFVKKKQAKAKPKAVFP